MKPGSDKILVRAVDALDRAELHLSGGDSDRAAERAYHSIVHAARVLLNESGTRSRAHDRVRRDLEALSPQAPASLVAALAEASDRRASGEGMSPADAEALVAMARSAVSDVRTRFEEESGDVRSDQSNPGIGGLRR